MRKFFVYFLTFVLAFGAPIPSFAGYAQLKPPPGWSRGLTTPTPGNAGTFNFGKAANADTVKGGSVLTNASLQVGGKMVVIPASMRIAANAAEFGATWSFGNPWIFGTLAVGSAAYNWFKDSGFEVRDGIWVKTDPTICTVAPCLRFKVLNFGWGESAFFQTKAEACASLKGKSANGNVLTATYVNASQSQCRGVINGGAESGGGFAQETVAPHDPVFVPVGDPEFHQKLDPKPLPDAVPKQLPQIDWPVEKPILNPDPAIQPQPRPAPDVSPRPRWEPTGDPVRNPNPDRNPDGSPRTNPDGSPITNPRPDTWETPGIRIKPANTPELPWQVDIVPEPLIKPDASPSPATNEPAPNNQPTPAPVPKDLITCGLPGTPPCKIDEAGTPEDGEKPLENAKTKVDEAEKLVKESVDKAATIEAPSWTFTFQFPTGCAPYETGLRGVILNICQWQGQIHDLMSMVWAGTTFFCIAGMVGRTIREA